MIEPEESFETWELIVRETIQSPEDFILFIPSINRLIDSIISTNELPENLQSYKNQFITFLCVNIVPRIISQSKQPDFVIDSYLELLKNCLRFLLYGLKIGDEKISGLSGTIFSLKESGLYVTNHENDIYKKLVGYLKEINFDSEALNILKQGVESVYIIQSIFIAISVMETIDFFELSGLIVD